jgi:hypothetical protein
MTVEVVTVRTFRNDLATIIATGKPHILGKPYDPKALILPIAVASWSSTREKRKARRAALRAVRDAFKFALGI